jgi:hypothetical protein
MRPDRLIREYGRTKRALTRLLMRSADSWRGSLFHEPPETAAKILLFQNEQPYMRLGYAFRELLSTISKAQEVAHFAASLWPSMRQRSEQWRRRFHLDASLRSLIGRAVLHIKVIDRLLHHADFFATAWAFDESNGDAPGVDGHDATLEGYYSLCRYRDNQALARITKEVAGSIQWIRIPPVEPKILSVSPELEPLVRRFRAANLLFSWLRLPDGQSVGQCYSSLFQIDLRKDRLKMDLGDLAGDLARDLSLPDPEHENIVGILRRVAQALSEMDYSTFVEAVLSEGGQDGPDSMIGNTEPINLIPSENKGSCCATLLALSTRRHRALAFPVVMRKVKAHLIECAGITKAVIFMTDTWDANEFINAHIGELVAHHRKGVRFLFLLAGPIPVGVSPLSIDLGRLP